MSSQSEKRFSHFWGISLLFLLLLFIVKSGEVYQGIEQALVLCARVVVPSLFPFMVLSGLYFAYGETSLLEKSLGKPFGNFFKLPRYAVLPFIFGLLFGFPFGVTTTKKLYDEKKLNNEEYRRCLCFCNNTSFSFVVAGVGLGICKNINDGILLFSAQVLSSVFLGLFMQRKKTKCALLENRKKEGNQKLSEKTEHKPKQETNGKTEHKPNQESNEKTEHKQNQETNGKIEHKPKQEPNIETRHEAKKNGFADIIGTASMQMLLIIGCVTFCSVLCYVFGSFLPSGCMVLLSAFLEIGTAMTRIASFDGVWVLPMLSFAISFGGFSVFLQSIGLLSKEKGIATSLFFAKCMQGVLASILTLLFLYLRGLFG